jgi:hypothetical protein
MKDAAVLARMAVCMDRLIELGLKPGNFNTDTEFPKSPMEPGQSQSQSQSYFKTGGLPPISSSWRQAP